MIASNGYLGDCQKCREPLNYFDNKKIIEEDKIAVICKRCGHIHYEPIFKTDINGRNNENN